MSGTPATTEPHDPQPATPPAASPGTKDASEQPTLTQAQFNAAIAEERRKWDEKTKREAEKAAKDAADAAAAEQGEFKKLAETRAARIVELETDAARIEALTTERDAAHAVIEALVEDELKLAPEYVAEAISERSPTAKLDYLRTHRDKWARTNGGGIPPTPRAAGQPSTDELLAAEIQRRKASGRYG